MIVQQASPLLQIINVVVHTEPIGTILWGIYWILFFTIAPFIVLPYVIIRTCIHVIQYILNCNTTISPIYQPNSTLSNDYNLGLVITGCDTGFGKELALYTASLGYTVFAGCLHVENCKEQFSTSRNIHPFQCDVTSDSDCLAASKIVSDWLSSSSSSSSSSNSTSSSSDGNEHNDSITFTKNYDSSSSVPLLSVECNHKKRYLFAIINNAGIDIPGETDTSKVSDFELHMNVNFFGQVRIVKTVLPLLKQQAINNKKGNNSSSSSIPMRILNVSSMAGICNGGIEKNPYHCSKHAVQAFTINLRYELHPFNIIVSSINPSFHSTPIVQLMQQHSNDQYDKWSQQDKNQYGEEYRMKLQNGTKKYVVWDSNVVVQQIVQRGLFVKYPIAEIIIGTDAKFILSTFGRMLPPFILQKIIQSERPIPICMK